MLIQFTVGIDNIFLLLLNLGKDIPGSGLGLPRPVKARNAAGKQLASLLQLRFLRIHFTDTRGNPGAIFPPEIQIPPRRQAKSAIGVPWAGRSRCRIGQRERAHQAFCRHFLTFNIRRKIQLWAIGSNSGLRLCFRERNTLPGNLHIRGIRYRFRNKRI